MTDPLSPFLWWQNREPSIFVGDVTFQPRRDGKSQGQLNTEAVERYKKKTGKSQGTLRGISKSERCTPKAYGRKSGVR